MQTLTWLDCYSDCVAAADRVMKQLKYNICTENQHRITGSRNFTEKWIVGADCLHTSNIRDHSKRPAMMNFNRKEVGEAKGESVVAFAPITKNLQTLPEDEQKKMEVKFDIAYTSLLLNTCLFPSTLWSAR